MKNNKVTKKMNFMEVIEKNPEAIGILFNRGMHCIGCGMASMETLEEGALAHGLDPDELVDEINSLIDTKKGKSLKTKNKINKNRKR
jgi:hybrid cluster-associated redox disulfide protein